MPPPDRVDDLLERAAAATTSGDHATAGALAHEAAIQLDVDDPDRHEVLLLAAALLGRAGSDARRGGAWTRATELHERALAAADAADPHGLRAGIAAQDLAMTCKYTGRFDDAERLYRRALAIAEANHHDELLAAVLHNLGGLAHARGDALHGIEHARRGIAVRATLDDERSLAEDRAALAGLLIDASELEEAERLLLDARAILADDELEVAIIDGNLAAIALRRDDLATATTTAARALRAKEAVLGTEHPDLAVTLTTLGTATRRAGDDTAAARLHQRARDVLLPHVDADHPLLTTIEHNLALAIGD